MMIDVYRIGELRDGRMWAVWGRVCGNPRRDRMGGRGQACTDSGWMQAWQTAA